MKETGLIYGTEMVRAILEGRKSQTRRTRGLEKINENPDEWGFSFLHSFSATEWHQREEFYFMHTSGEQIGVKCPYGGVGDLLYGKEVWGVSPDLNNVKPSDIPIYEPIWYKATDTMGHVDFKWRSSRFMPKRMARIWQEITRVRPERLDAITEEDAKAEGVVTCLNAAFTDYRHHFMVLWDSLNTKRGHGWETNPWCWVIESKRIEPR